MGTTVTGLDSLINKLNALGGNSGKSLDKALMKAGKLVEGDAKDLCTVKNGRLRNSIHTKMGGTVDSYSYEDNNGNKFSGALSSLGDIHTVSVGTNVEYAAYVEMGTGRRGADSPSPPKYDGASYIEDWAGMEAQPYLWPALQQNKENIAEVVKSELIKEIRKLGG